MKISRAVALLLSVAIVSLACISCGAEVTTSSDTTPPEGTTKAWVDVELPDDLNYEGEQVRVLSRQRDWFYDELSLETDEVMNIIDESVYNRELYVEERLGFDIDVEKYPYTKDSDLTNLARTYFDSNTDAYDILAGSCYHVMELSTEGVVWNLYEVEHLDLSNPWYAQNYVNAATVNDSLFFVTGDAALTLMRFAFVTFVNLELAETYSIGDIYKTVDEKGWTIDYLYSTVENIYDDLNSNGASDDGDLFGFSTSNVTGVDMFWSSFDLDILGKNDEGFLEVVIDTEKCAEAVSKLCDLYFTNRGVRVPVHASGDTEYETMMTAFSSDQYLFTNLRLISVEGDQFINMESKYGIIPTPLWDSDQENYQIYVHDQYSVFGILGTVPEDRLPMLGAFLESFSNYSYNETRDVYFETALKGRYARDEASRRMLDLIINSVYIDAGWIYSACLERFALILRGLVKDCDYNWASTYRTKGNVLSFYLKRLNEKLGG